jgi:hypothetical protein
VEGVGDVYSHARTSLREGLPGRRPSPPSAGGHERCTERRARGTMARSTTQERRVESRRAYRRREGCARHCRDQRSEHTRCQRRLRRGTVGGTHFIAESTIAEVDDDAKGRLGGELENVSRAGE